MRFGVESLQCTCCSSLGDSQSCVQGNPPTSPPPHLPTIHPFSDCNWLLMWKSIPVRSGPLSAPQSCQNHYDPKTHPVFPEGCGFCQGGKKGKGKRGWGGEALSLNSRCLYMCDGRLSFCRGLYCMLAFIFHLLLPVIWCQCGKCLNLQC